MVAAASLGGAIHGRAWRHQMNSTRENWLALALLDVLLAAMGFLFVARAFLRYLAAGRRRHKNGWAG